MLIASLSQQQEEACPLLPLDKRGQSTITLLMSTFRHCSPTRPSNVPVRDWKIHRPAGYNKERIIGGETVQTCWREGGWMTQTLFRVYVRVRCIIDGGKKILNKYKSCKNVLQGHSDFAKDDVSGSISFHEIITFLLNKHCSCLTITLPQKSKEKWLTEMVCKHLA